MKVIELKEKNKYVIRMEPGDEIMQSLGIFSKQHEGKFAYISSGLGGGFTGVKGYFSQSEKLHGQASETKTLPGMLELTSITGNITWMNGQVVVHAHATFANKDFQCFGLHLVEAKLKSITEKDSGLTAEIVAEISETRVSRGHDEDTGLPLVLSAVKTEESGKLDGIKDLEIKKLTEENNDLKKQNAQLNKAVSEFNQITAKQDEQIAKVLVPAKSG